MSNRTENKEGNKKKSIMIFAPLPYKGNPAPKPLYPENEITKIFQLFKNNDKYEVISTHYYDTYGENFQKHLLEHKPSIIHFTGHGKEHEGGASLCFKNKDGYTYEIEASKICEIFSQIKSIECVVLNACYSDSLADLLANSIDNVVGMKGEFLEVTGVEFVEGFYDALAKGHQYIDAFSLGCSYIKTKTSEKNVPHLGNIAYDLKKIARDLIKQRCVLFLGPNLSSDDTNPHKKFFNWLVETYNNSLVKHEGDDLIVYKKGAKNIQIINQKIEAHYEETIFYREILEKIAELPFHIIVPVTPDTSLKKIMDEKNKNYLFDYFAPKFDKDPKHKESQYAPKSECPLIYHLFGCVETGTPIVTHHMLFNYLGQVIKSPDNIDSHIREISKHDNIQTLLFLGFEFDKWYYQLLLFLLELNNNKDNRKQYSFNMNCIDKDNCELTENVFDIVYVNTNVGDFIDKLHLEITQKCNV